MFCFVFFLNGFEIPVELMAGCFRYNSKNGRDNEGEHPKRRGEDSVCHR